MIDPNKLKPFDEAAALYGEPVCDLNGKPVTQLVKFDVALGINSWAGVYKGYLCTFNEQYLRMAPKVREVWVRVQILYESALISMTSTEIGPEAEQKLNEEAALSSYRWIGPAVKAGEIEE